MTTLTASRYKRPMWMFIILLLVFGLPLVLAWIGWQEQDNFGQGTTNHGQLLQPPLDLSKLPLDDSLAKALTPEVWQGRWLMLYVNPQSCTESCEKNLYYLRQIRKATGKNSDRIQRAILTFAQAKPDQRLETGLAKEFAGTLHLVTPTQQFAHFVHNTPQASTVLQQGGVYLVDPLGNIMMYYPPNTEPMGIFKDLTRLLKLSHIG